MKALIQKLEAATGPSRELGKEVLLACGWKIDHEAFGIASASEIWVSPNGDEYDAVAGMTPLPNPTASIDAALTLVPEGWEWLKKSPHVFSVYDDRIDYDATKTWAVHIDGCHVVPAIALCICALKARVSK